MSTTLDGSHCSPASEPCAVRHRLVRIKPVWFGLFPVLILSVSVLAQRVMEVGPIGLTVADLDRQLRFFTNVLVFQLESDTTRTGAAWDQLYGLDQTMLRQATLSLGAERITLTQHSTQPSRPIPPDSRSLDHWFQHIAIVVRDMEAAYTQLRRHKVKHVSTAPQTLPAWNPDAAANDLVFWHTSLRVEALDPLADTLREMESRFVSRRIVNLPGVRSLVIRDPDGHPLQLVEPVPDPSP